MAVVAQGVAKKFCRTLGETLRYGATDTARAFWGRAPNGERLRAGEFWALRDCEFSLAAGNTLALIGPNGAGKSTLLKILNGIIAPDRGRVEIQGRVGTLLELGAGIHPLLTGRENVFINGSVLGMRQAEIKRRLDAIVDFAGIGDFLDVPVKHYSSGMYVRLAFAIAVHAEPEVLLIDEALAVGDAAFKVRCVEKLLELQDGGAALILVSHDINLVERLCRRCLVLMQGRQAFLGDTRTGIQTYFHELGAADLRHVPTPQARGAGQVTFTNVRVQARERTPADPIPLGADLVIAFDYAFAAPPSPGNQVRVTVRTFAGRDVQKFFFQDVPHADGRRYANDKILPLAQHGTVRLIVRAPRWFPQTFRLDVALLSLRTGLHLGALADAAAFTVVHPATDVYLEYGNGTITDVPYDVVVE